jgi:hypothetical protein
VRALRQAELLIALAPRIRALAEQGQKLLHPPDIELEAGKEELVRARVAGKGSAAALESLERALEQVKAALSGADDIDLVGEIILRGRKKP